jgi:hypothetical protein
MVLLDGSQSMASRESSASRRIRDLVRSGFQDQIVPGDSLSAWTFTSELKTNRFVTQVWSATNSPLLAEFAGRYVESENYSGRTRFTGFAPELNAWMARQSHALVLFLTDGEDPVMGLPNDIEINEYMSQRRGPARTARRAFLVAYLVEGGRVTRWLAHDGLGPVQLPRLPIPEPPPRPAAVAEPAEEKAPIEEAPQAPVIELPPGAKILQNPPPPSPVAIEPAAPAPELAAAEEPEATLAKEMPDALVEPVPPQTEAAQVVTSPEVAEVKGVTTQEAPPAAASESSIAPSVASATNGVTAPAATLADPEPLSRRSFPYAAGAIVCGLIVAAILLKRPRKTDASLISRSLTKK